MTSNLRPTEPTYLRPGDAFQSFATGLPTGLVGDVNWRLHLDGSDTDLLGPTTDDVTEEVTGTYRAVFTIPSDAPTSTTDTYSVYWANGGDSARDDALSILIVAQLPSPIPVTEGHYTSPNAVRALLGVDDTTLTDDAAFALIVDAEDYIDSLLGAWYVDETTGRKILQADVQAWQWDKLVRAATKTAAALYQAPALLTARRYRKESGPDFTLEDPQGGGPLAPAITLLNASGLRRLGGRARAGNRQGARHVPDGWVCP